MAAATDTIQDTGCMIQEQLKHGNPLRAYKMPMVLFYEYFNSLCHMHVLQPSISASKQSASKQSTRSHRFHDDA